MEMAKEVPNGTLGAGVPRLQICFYLFFYFSFEEKERNLINTYNGNDGTAPQVVRATWAQVALR